MIALHALFLARADETSCEEDALPLKVATLYSEVHPGTKTGEISTPCAERLQHEFSRSSSSFGLIVVIHTGTYVHSTCCHREK